MFRRILFWFSALCGVTSLLINISSVAGFDIRKEFPFVFVLHVIAIGIMFYCVLLLKRNREFTEAFARQGNGLIRKPVLLSFALKTRPRLLVYFVGLTLTYGFVTFFLFILQRQYPPAQLTGTPHVPGDLQDAEKIARRINAPDINDLKIFSAVWFYFFSLEAGILWPFRKKGID